MASESRRDSTAGNSGCDPVGCGCIVALLALVGGLISGRGVIESVINAALVGGSTVVVLVGIGVGLTLLVGVAVGAYLLIGRLWRSRPWQSEQPTGATPDIAGTAWWTSRPHIEFDRHNLAGVYSRDDELLVVRRQHDGSYVVEGLGQSAARSQRSMFDVWDATKLSADPDDAIRWQALAAGRLSTATGHRSVTRSVWPGSVWARIVGLLLLALSILLIAFVIVEVRLGMLISERPTAATTEISNLSSIEDGIIGLYGPAFWITAVAWLIWLFRSVRAARDVGVRLSLSPAWSVIVWFIPFVVLVGGYRSVRQLFNLPGLKAQPIVGAWWALFLVGSLITRTTASAMANVTELNKLLGLLPWEVAGDSLLMISGLLAVWIVASVDRALQNATAPIGPVTGQPSRPVDPVAASAIASVQAPSRPTTGGDGRTLLLRRTVALAAVVTLIVLGAWATFTSSSLRLPASTSTLSPSALIEADARALGLSTHRIGTGESTFGVAAAERVTATELINANVKYYPDIATTTPPIGSLLLIPRTTQSVSTATARPTPTPGPTHPYPVVLRPEQVVMPATEFPLAGYAISRDAAGNSPPLGRRWIRDFDSTTGQYWWASFIVTVYEPDVAATSAIARTSCNTIWDWSTSREQPVISEIRAEVIGDGAKACRYAFPTLSDVVSYTTGTRNLTVTVSVSVRTVDIPPAVATCVLLAKQQLGIVERVAPR